MGKVTKVEIPEGSGNYYRYEYDDESQSTRYLGPVGEAPTLAEEEFEKFLISKLEYPSPLVPEWERVNKEDVDEAIKQMFPVPENIRRAHFHLNEWEREPILNGALYLKAQKTGILLYKLEPENIEYDNQGNIVGPSRFKITHCIPTSDELAKLINNSDIEAQHVYQEGGLDAAIIHFLFQPENFMAHRSYHRIFPESSEYPWWQDVEGIEEAYDQFLWDELGIGTIHSVKPAT